MRFTYMQQAGGFVCPISSLPTDFITAGAIAGKGHTMPYSRAWAKAAGVCICCCSVSAAGVRPYIAPPVTRLLLRALWLTGFTWLLSSKTRGQI
jgi:hypothetical protein